MKLFKHLWYSIFHLAQLGQNMPKAYKKNANSIEIANDRAYRNKEVQNSSFVRPENVQSHRIKTILSQRNLVFTGNSKAMTLQGTTCFLSGPHNYSRPIIIKISRTGNMAVQHPDTQNTVNINLFTRMYNFRLKLKTINFRQLLLLVVERF